MNPRYSPIDITAPLDAAAVRRELPALLHLALPVIASELGWMAMWIVDTVMVGRLGPTALGAVSLGGHVFFTISMFGIGLMLGLDYTVATAVGARRMDDARAELHHGIVLAVALSVALTAVLIAAASALASYGAAPELAAQAAAYLRATTVGLLPLLLFFALRRYLQAMELAKPVMVTIVTANLINLVADWALIYGRLGLPALGAEGAGWATCVSRVYMLLCLVAYVGLLRRRDTTDSGRRPLERERFIRLVRLGLPAAAQTTLEVGAFTAATIAVARLSTVDLAAHQVALSIAATTFMVPLGLSSAGAVRVGRAVGARESRSALAAGWAALGCAATFMSVAALTLVVTRYRIVALFTSDTAVIELGATLLLVAAAFQLFDGIQVTAAGVLRGVGNSRAAMLANLGGHWLVGLPAGLTLCFTLGAGVLGLWIGLSIGLISVAIVLLSLWIRRGRALARTTAPVQPLDRPNTRQATPA